MRSLRLSVAVIGAAAAISAGPAAAQAPGTYWCEPARAYYPQVANCPAPWRVLNAAQTPARPGFVAPPYVPYPTQYAPYDNYNHGNGP